MRDVRRRAWVLVALVAALAAAVLMIAFVLRGGPADELLRRTALVASVLAIVGAVSPVLAWARSERRRAASVSTSAQVEAAADLLAVRTTATWSKELLRRGIEAPAPVRVRWRWAGGDVALPLRDLASSASRSSDPEPLPVHSVDGSAARQVLSSGLVTRLHDEVYSRLRHGRLVLIGGPGAGKTGAMMLLLMEALQQRDETPDLDRVKVPVPVWLTLGSWDPTARGLREWVVATMARDYPYLGAEEFGPDAVGQLFDTGRIALFLDGLDEMPDAQRSRAVELLIAETAGLRVTLTSRPEQYRATLVAGWQLPYTAVVELHPVSPRAAARYLLDGQIGLAKREWQQVTDRLQADPDGVLARTLSTPLTLSLARSAYGGKNPGELLSPGLDSEDALRKHLLDHVLITAYPDPRKRAHAVYWLEWVADQMNSQAAGPTRDLRWWEIGRWVFRWRRQLLGAAVGGLVCVPGIALLYVLDVDSDLLRAILVLLVIVGGLAAGLVVALVVGHSAGIGPSTTRRRPARHDVRWVENKFAGGLRVGLAAGISSCLLTAGLLYFLQGWSGLLVLVVGGVVVGSVVGVAFGFVVGPSDRDPQAMVLRVPTAYDLRRGRRRIVLSGLPAGLIAGLLSYVFILGEETEHPASFAVLVAIAFGLPFGLILWLFSDVWTLPIATAANATPFSVYRKDIQARLFSALLFGLMGALLAAFTFALITSGSIGRNGVTFQRWLVSAVVLGLWLGLNVGLVLGLVGGLRSGATPPLFSMEIAFALRRRPVRFIALLESAREQQVLRQAGAVYQFRHADLQDRLAERYRRRGT